MVFRGVWPFCFFASPSYQDDAGGRQDGPKTTQEASKWAPKWLQRISRRPKRDSPARTFLRKPSADLLEWRYGSWKSYIPTTFHLLRLVLLPPLLVPPPDLAQFVPTSHKPRNFRVFSRFLSLESAGRFGAALHARHTTGRWFSPVAR